MGRHALLIGIDDYQFAPLSSCVNDAVALRDMLVKLDLFKADECTLMTSPLQAQSGRLPTRKEILQFLLGFYDSQQQLDRLFVFFAGHGLSVRLGRAADELRTAIVPAGVHQLRHSGDELIDLDELLGRFARRGVKEQYWIIDACRNVAEDVVPNVTEIGWDRPAANDAREAYEMAQAVLYAVAPLGQARAAVGGHGVVTGHILDALGCRGEAEWGAGGWYDEARNSWLFDLESLADYARRRIEPTLSKGSWQARYLLPRCWKSEKKPGPLLEVNAIKDRPFGVYVSPPEAASALAISLKVKRHTVSSWPPRANGELVMLTPERYRLEVQLSDQASDWMPPQVPDPPVVDLRDVGRFDIVLQPRIAARVEESLGRDEPPPSDPNSAAKTGSVTLAVTAVAPEFIPSTDPQKGPKAFRDEGPGQGGHYELPEPTVTVRATDPGVTLHLFRLTGGNEEREEKPNVPIRLSEGLWRIEIRIGNDVIGLLEDDFAAGEHYDLDATAQITPALAALILGPEGEVFRAPEDPPRALMPSETIGAMQGAILPTLLPLFALKPLDSGNQVLSSFSPRLGIPHHEQRSSIPLAVALAFDGAWSSPDLGQYVAHASVRAGIPGTLIWRDGSRRTSIFIVDDVKREDMLTLAVPGRTISVASPKLPNYCATVAATLWPDGRNDVSVSLFKLPAGSDQAIRPGRLSRALTIAARLSGAGKGVDEVDYDVFSMISEGSQGDPVLGALAWFARDSRLKRDRSLVPELRNRLIVRQGLICQFLVAVVPQLADTRVIDAVSGSNPALALDVLLDDNAMTQPVLAGTVSVLAKHAISRGHLKHWSVIRFQDLDADAVFNVASVTTVV
ncbi:hypothetical protein GR210_12380 [Rhizobium leguminosarum]|uniref:caspase family protein n=1 Tax=Rhizobium leguminosarum TaxID=384 RepID=UPI0013DC3CF4|nr:caspase family protein [Rhizobium leguminosarum]NEH49579.1 hypothetical protein [Rhizobium leguminosarum]